MEMDKMVMMMMMMMMVMLMVMVVVMRCAFDSTVVYLIAPQRLEPNGYG